MDNKETFRIMIDIADNCAEVMKPLNQEAINFFSNEATASMLKSVSSVSSLNGAGKMAEMIRNTIQPLIDSYGALFEKCDLNTVWKDRIKTLFAGIQMDTILQLTQSFQTDMIRDLTRCFANANYEYLPKVFNHTLSQQIIKAPDIAFIRTSEVAQIVHDELKYPRGFITSLNNLNKSTARVIAKNDELSYKVEGNCFVGSSGKADSKCLNVIVSGQELINDGQGERFSEKELIDFCSHLSETPTLALMYETGRAIKAYIKELFSEGKNSTSFDKSVYYHCRSHKEGEMSFTYDEMLKAPKGMPWAGRFNHIGTSVYYFADTRYGAEVEVNKHKSKDTVLQTVRIVPDERYKINMLDLSGVLQRGRVFLKHLRFSVSNAESKMPREYLLPGFVADCCRDIGFEGIKYYGTEDYNNYVTWYDHFFKFGGMCE